MLDKTKRRAAEAVLRLAQGRKNARSVLVLDRVDFHAIASRVPSSWREVHGVRELEGGHYCAVGLSAVALTVSIQLDEVVEAHGLGAELDLTRRIEDHGVGCPLQFDQLTFKRRGRRGAARRRSEELGREPTELRAPFRVGEGGGRRG